MVLHPPATFDHWALGGVAGLSLLRGMWATGLLRRGSSGGGCAGAARCWHAAGMAGGVSSVGLFLFWAHRSSRYGCIGNPENFGCQPEEGSGSAAEASWTVPPFKIEVMGDLVPSGWVTTMGEQLLFFCSILAGLVQFLLCRAAGQYVADSRRVHALGGVLHRRGYCPGLRRIGARCCLGDTPPEIIAKGHGFLAKRQVRDMRFEYEAAMEHKQ